MKGSERKPAYDFDIIGAGPGGGFLAYLTGRGRISSSSFGFFKRI